jgi:hypothetical protein
MNKKNLVIVVGVIFLIVVGAVVVKSLLAQSEHEKQDASLTTFDPSVVKGASGLQVTVNYTGKWTGYINTNEGNKIMTRTVKGEGSETFNLPGIVYAVGFDFQKMDGTNNNLTASLVQDGSTLNSTSTSERFGIIGMWRSFSVNN